MMPLTRSFRDTVRKRVEQDAEFRAALREEVDQALRDGDVEAAEAILRDIEARAP
jgi:hypothetical protein